jgi:pyruvate,orthophosphate dikinase
MFGIFGANKSESKSQKKSSGSDNNTNSKIIAKESLSKTIENNPILSGLLNSSSSIDEDTLIKYKKELAIAPRLESKRSQINKPTLKNEEKNVKPIAKGLPAGPGGATGQIVFTAQDAVEWTKEGKKVILVREETNPEDVEGMRAAVGILTARGGMTSHAALVARGWGKCCVVGCSLLKVDPVSKVLIVGEHKFNEGDFITLNGSKGNVYAGKMNMVRDTENPNFIEFMKIVDSIRKLKVRTNADTPEDAKKAIEFGAEGIGLFRTEHMFYGKGSEEPLFYLRKMIASKTKEEREEALSKLYPFIKQNIKGTLEVMENKPVTIRLLDPPLHEFIPNREDERKKLAESLGITLEEFNKRAEELHESNPMMGHRGVRLGITYSEITEVWVRAIFESTAELIKEGKKVFPEIMIPVVSIVTELKHQKDIVEKIYKDV